MMTELFIVTLVLSIGYAVFLFWCIKGWMLTQEVMASALGDVQHPFVSVIIPARNEADNIANCLSDFLHQDYPPDSFELIVADDHSTDNTAEIVAKFIQVNPSLRIKLFKVGDGGKEKTYKKQAITEAIAVSAGELIITTDADCRRGRRWLGTLSHYFKRYQPDMISAPVIFEGEKGWLEKIQSLEFLGLIAIGASAIKNKKPFLCNGANLAFSKKAFIECGGYESSEKFSSGDDTQLMMKIVSRGKNRIHFVKSISATVTTFAQKSFLDLLSQRKRWASKIPLQMNFFTIIISLIAYFLHAGLFISGMMMLFNGNIYAFFVPMLIKIVPEFILLAGVSGFFRKSKLLYLFLPAQIVYPVYISIIGLMALSGSYQWKGRKVK